MKTERWEGNPFRGRRGQLGGQRSDVFLLNDVSQGNSAHQRSDVLHDAPARFWLISESTFTKENWHFSNLKQNYRFLQATHFPYKYSSLLSADHSWWCGNINITKSQRWTLKTAKRRKTWKSLKTPLRCPPYRS